MGIIFTIIVFVIALTLLIAVHEYGHFIVARWCGVKVELFSIGFGKALCSWHSKAGTEYRIARIPLGGYIQMVDEEIKPVAPADQPYAFNRKPIWHRIAIVLAGPGFNLIFAVLAYWLVFILGIKALAPVIGGVTPDSIAEQARLQVLDEIVAVDEQETSTWQGVVLELISWQGDEEPVTVYVEHTETGEQGKRTLDLSNWRMTRSSGNVLESLGITPYVPIVEPIIDYVEADSAAEKTGFQPGDKVVAVDGQPITHWFEVVEYVQRNADRQIVIDVVRTGELRQITVQPTIRITAAGDRIGYLGIVALPLEVPEGLIREQRYGFFPALKQALIQTGQITVTTLVVIGKMFTGSVSLGSLSGPIGIAQSAGQSASFGFVYFLNFLALVSISLAVINLLPIPMLDGGHLFFYLIELVFRKPVPKKVRHWAFMVGLGSLVFLMTVVIANDLVKLLT